MRHFYLRTRLVITYFVSVVLAVTLTPIGYQWMISTFGGGEPPTSIFVVAHTIGMAAVLSLVYGYIMGHYLLRQIEALAVGARRVAAGDLETRVPLFGHGQDELTQLGATFNDMVARLGESLDHQKRLEQARRDLVANVAHDLRTPLAAIQASVEALEEGVVQDKATEARYLAAVGRETRHLGRLIDDLFALSQLEAGQLELKPEPLYLEDIVQDCLSGLLPQLERQGIALAVDLPATLPPAWADRHAARRVLSNLLQNAAAFTPAGGRITVCGEQAAATVQIQVSDTGPGIPPGDLEPGADGLPRIFERFYRGDQARSGGGAGLGLAIASQLAQAQRGQVEATSVVGEGTTMSFTLPRADRMN